MKHASVLLLSLGVLLVLLGESQAISREFVQKNNLQEDNLERREEIASVQKQRRDQRDYEIVLNLQTTPSGTYHTSVGLGTPPQSFELLIDTGSANLAVQGLNCQQDPSKKPCEGNEFKPKDSSTFEQIPCSPECNSCSDGKCGFYFPYSDGAYLSGFVYRDIASVGNLQTNGTLFGNYEKESDGFVANGVDGVWGLAYKDAALIGTTTLFDQLVLQNGMKNQFSLCFGRYGGVMLLGGKSADFYSGELQFVPITKKRFYAITMLELQVDKSPVDIDQDQFIPTVIDTSSQDIQLTKPAFESLSTFFRNRYCAKPNSVPRWFWNMICYEGQSLFDGVSFMVDPTKMSYFPTLQMVITGVSGQISLEVTPSHYLREVENGKMALAISPNSESGTVLGTHFLRAYYVLFDREKDQVGFAPSANCTGATYIMTPVSGVNQTGVAGRTLKEPLGVQIVYLNDSTTPAVGVEVHFRVVSRLGGAVEKTTVATNEEGIASTRFTLAKTAGENYVLVSLDKAVGSPVTFNATGTPNNIWLILGGISVVLAAIPLTLLIFWTRKQKKKEEGYQMVSQSEDA